GHRPASRGSVAGRARPRQRAYDVRSDSHSDIGTYSHSPPSPLSDLVSAPSSGAAALAAGAFFFRPRPPREPLRVRFFGAVAGSAPSSEGASSISSPPSPRSAAGTWIRGAGAASAAASGASGSGTGSVSASGVAPSGVPGLRL